MHCECGNYNERIIKKSIRDGSVLGNGPTKGRMYVCANCGRLPPKPLTDKQLRG